MRTALHSLPVEIMRNGLRFVSAIIADPASRVYKTWFPWYAWKGRSGVGDRFAEALTH
jgi:hypothetical protein